MHRIGVRSVAAVLVLVAACIPPSPTPSGEATIPSSPPPTASATATPTPTPRPVPILRIAVAGDFAGGLSNAASGADAVRAAGFIHDGLVRLDERLLPIPLLASERPAVSPDGLTWTVRLRRDVTFSDGSPLTADDVLRTYDIARSHRCPFIASSCLSAVVERTVRIDDHTVAFTIRRPMPGFAVDHLRIGIESAAAIDAAFATFRTGAARVAVADTVDYLAQVSAEEAFPTGPAGPGGTPTVDYGPLREAGEAILDAASLARPEPDAFTVDGRLDVAGYVQAVAARVRAIDATFTSRPTDALAAAYPYLATAGAPVTTGPYRPMTSAGADGLTLVTNPDYFLGAPRIERIEFRTVGTGAAAVRSLAAGAVDWLPTLSDGAQAAIAADPGVRSVTYPELGFYALTFNLHPEAEGLFLDPNLRIALASCFDRPATALAATQGRGAPIDTEIPAMSWAYPASGLATHPLDRRRARALIEASGWTLGADGIYAKDGRRLSTVVAVRDGFPERLDWVRRVGEQVRGCGIELAARAVGFDAILRMLRVYPHVNAAAPDADRPFDAYFGGLDVGLDPDPFSLYHSSECSTAKRPDTRNVGCYADPAVDRLIDAGRRETDPVRRAAIYRAYAIRISEDLPVIYAWSDVLHEGIGAGLGTTAPGGLHLDTPTWYQPIEGLTNVP
jgi:ABC-type transport system substrate-binding protein